jgi:hypothetical protein
LEDGGELTDSVKDYFCRRRENAKPIPILVFFIFADNGPAWRNWWFARVIPRSRLAYGRGAAQECCRMPDDAYDGC